MWIVCKRQRSEENISQVHEQFRERVRLYKAVERMVRGMDRRVDTGVGFIRHVGFEISSQAHAVAGGS